MIHTIIDISKTMTNMEKCKLARDLVNAANEVQQSISGVEIKQYSFHNMLSDLYVDFDSLAEELTPKCY